MGLDPQVLAGIPQHRIARLRRQGERYFTDGLRDISSDRRWAILAVCAVEREAAVADAVVETHDRIVGKTWRETKEETGLTLQRLYSADICEQSMKPTATPLASCRFSWVSRGRQRRCD